MNYKLVLYGNKIYQEVEIHDDFKNLTIGTDKKCQIWLPEKKYSDKFTITIEKDADNFIALCDQSVYFYSENGIHEYFHKLVPGERLQIALSASDVVILYMDFDILFKEIQKDYRLCIDTAAVSKFSIGCGGSSISISDPVLQSDYVIFRKSDSGYQIDTSHIRFGVEINGISVHEKNIAVKDRDFVGIYGYVFYIYGTQLLTSDQIKIITAFKVSQVKEQNNQFKYPEFIRNVRLRYVQPDEKVEVLQPKPIPQKPQKSALYNLLPIIVMMVFMAVMRLMMHSNVLYALYFVVMMGMSVAVSIITYIQSKKKYKADMIHREQVYNEYIDKKEEQINKIREEEKTIAYKMDILPQETIEQIGNFDGRLFEKIRSDDDYLDVPIGTGIVDSVNQISYKEQEYVDVDDPMMDIPEKMHDVYKAIDSMPIVIHLAQLNAVGIIGVRNKLYQFAKNLIITIAGQHFYNDVKFYVLIDKEDVPYFSWVRWLKNTWNDSIRNILYDDESKKAILEELYNELSVRENSKEQEISAAPHFIVFAYRSDRINGHPVMNYVERARQLGFTFIFFEEYKELLNEACDEVIYLDRESNQGFVQEVKDAVKMQGFYYEHISRDQIASAALKLACVHVNEISLESKLTKNISLYKLLNIMSAYDLNIGSRWKQSDISKSMAAAIGVDSNDQIVRLDIHEKAHGPHGMVAGTTGAGKSELLQTYVLSMCTQFHPYEVSFIIIDFKGGGMANQFRDLPHLNGAITNIDGKQIDRSLMSIKAELMKRQRLFAEYNVNRIDDYINLFKKGVAKIPLPHMILIVDEFAELKSDQPEFMKELISAARIGRSLGVHLILATQKPAGVINDQIWSNSRFKLCLKVQDKADSKEVLKSPLAAEIKEPGRCYLQVGNNEIFQLFQSAYSGEKANVDAVDQRRKYEIATVDLDGRRHIVYQQKPKEQEGSESQLEAVVSYIKEYCDQNNIAKLPDICLPPLAEIIDYPVEAETDNTSDIVIPIGIYDDPSQQLQKPFSLNITQNNCYITGSSLSGKTNLMQTMIRGLAEEYTPEDVNIYIVDFASMILRNFEGLSHLGGVVTISEDNKLKQLIKMILGIIDERKKKLSQIGLSSYSSYRDSGYRDMPQIVIFIDNYAAFQATYADIAEEYQIIMRDGISVGVSSIVTNTISSGFTYRLLANFSERMALYNNDSSQYGTLFDHCKLQPDHVAGRGIVKINNDIREFQSYLSFSAEKEVERVTKIREFVKEINSRSKDARAKIIPTIPEDVTELYLEKNYGWNSSENHYQVPLGIRYDSINPEYIDLLHSNLLTMFGREELGRLEYLLYFMQYMDIHAKESPVQMYIFDDVNRELIQCSKYATVAKYTTSTDDVEPCLTEVFQEAKTRYEQMTKDPSLLDTKPLILVVFNSKLSQDMIAVSATSAKIYEMLGTKLKGCKICLMQTNVENATVSFKAASLRMHIENGTVLGFEDIREMKVVSPTVSIIRNSSRNLEKGDVYCIRGDKYVKLRAVLH